MRVRNLTLALSLTLLTPASSASPLHWNTKRVLSIQKCPPRMSGLLVVSMPLVREILFRAQDRLEDLYLYVSQQDVPNIEGQEAMLASTFRTYTALIERDPETAGRRSTFARQRTINRVFKMYNLTRTMHRNLNDPTIHFEIWCEDDWWIPYGFYGGPLPFQGQYLDHRVTVAPEEDSRRQLTPLSPMWTGEQPLNVAYTATEDMAGPYKSVTVFNKRFFKHWYAVDQTPWSIAKIRHLPVEDLHSFPVSGLASMWQLPTVLLHEFSHSPTIATKEQQLFDAGLNTGEVLTDMDTFKLLTWLTRWDHIPPRNAESWAVMVVTLYLDKWDWSTGVNRPLEEARELPDRGPSVEDGIKIPDVKKTLQNWESQHGNTNFDAQGGGLAS